MQAARPNLAAFAQSACCDWLFPHSSVDARWRAGDAAPDQAEGLRGLVLLDAAGGPVSVQPLSWKDMIRTKLGAEQLA